MIKGDTTESKVESGRVAGVSLNGSPWTSSLARSDIHWSKQFKNSLLVWFIAPLEAPIETGVCREFEDGLAGVAGVSGSTCLSLSGLRVGVETGCKGVVTFD